jgi:phosphatidylglycerophosphate synthase
MWHAFINLTGLAIVLVFGHVSFWIVGSTVSFLFFVVLIPKWKDFGSSRIGMANWITLTRLLIVFFVFTQAMYLSDLMLFGVILIVIIMDGVDGSVARKLGQSSDVGENLDMETDAFMVLVLSWLHFNNNDIGIWILLPGGFRYFYGIAFFWFSNPPLLPSKKIRSTIAVIYFVALLTPFLLTRFWYEPILLISGVGIMISFGVSIYDGVRRNC